MVFQALLLPFLAGAGIGAGMSGIQGPMTIGFNKLSKHVPGNANELINLHYRGEISRELFLEEMSANGYNEKNADLLLTGQQTILDTNENITLFRRHRFDKDEVKNREEFDKRMESIGITKNIAQDLLNASEVIETPQQIVTFLVREVLSPELRKQLELDSEFPESSLPDFAKIGIPEQLARRIWAAHWELPDIARMAVAHHRFRGKDKKFWEKEVTDLGLDPTRVQTEVEDISALLKFQDVGTVYRDKVLATIFNDLGQIQLRWLIRFRFFSFEEAVYRHERQGLPKVQAELVTKVVFVVQSITDWRDGIKQGAFTWDDVRAELTSWQITEQNIIDTVKRKVSPEITEGVSDERRLSKSLFFRAFDVGEISRSELIDNLRSINYDETQSKFMVEVHEANKQLKQIEESVRSGLTKADIKKGFREGQFDAEEAVRRLVERGMQRTAAEELIQIEGASKARQAAKE